MQCYEQHDSVSGHDDELLVVKHSYTFSLTALWKSSDGLDRIPKVARCREENIEVAINGVGYTFVFFDAQDVDSGHVAPEVLGRTELGKRWTIVRAYESWLAALDEPVGLPCNFQESGFASRLMVRAVLELAFFRAVLFWSASDTEIVLLIEDVPGPDDSHRKPGSHLSHTVR
jgi:hypothetical protein